MLAKFEFRECDNRADDHRWYELKLPGVPKIVTHFSHGRQDISADLWQKIAAQLKVRTHYLDGMMDCTNGRDDYYQQVKDDPYPPWPAFVLNRLRE